MINSSLKQLSKPDKMLMSLMVLQRLCCSLQIAITPIRAGYIGIPDVQGALLVSILGNYNSSFATHGSTAFWVACGEIGQQTV